MTQKSKKKLLSAIKTLEKKKLRFKKKRDNYSGPLKLKLVLYLQSELQSSTTHGLPYIANTSFHYVEKTFWIVNIAACIVVMIVLLNMQYLRFVASPTVMSVERNYFDWNISYPAITLCPLYKPDLLRFGKFINDTNDVTGLNLKGYMWAISQSALDTLDYLDLSSPKDELQLIDPKEYARIAATMFRNFGKGYLTTSTNWSISIEAAMTEMGMCHVINSNVAIYDQPHNWNTMDQSFVKKNIELSVFDADFFTLITDYAAIYKVFIHSPDENTMTTGSSFGFDVEGLISFGLSVWSTRISEELRDQSLQIRKCRFINEPISKRYPIYSFNHCMLECRIKMIQRLCGCVPHFYKPLDNERVCYIRELQCVLQYRKDIMTLQTSEESYKKISDIKDIPKISRDCGCVSTCDHDLYYKDNENFVPQKGLNKLQIKITAFPRVRVVRDIIFNFYDMVLKSGGVMNLCIGSSLISVIEFVLVVLKLIAHLTLQTIRFFASMIIK